MGKSCGGARCSEPGWAQERKEFFVFDLVGPGVRGQDERDNERDKWKETSFFSRDSEAAFGSERATRGGSFWTRIRLGKGVAGSGVRGSRSAGAKGRPGGWLGLESDGEKLWRRQGVWD